MKYATITFKNGYKGAMGKQNITTAFLNDICRVLARREGFDAEWADRQCARYQNITGHIVWIEPYGNMWLVTIYEDADLTTKVDARFAAKWV